MSLNTARKKRHDTLSAWLKIVAVLVLFLGFIVNLLPRTGNTYHDSDTWMRLAFIEQCLTDYFTGYTDPTHPHTGGFIGHLTQYWYRHEGAGYGGMPIHWTLPYDLLVALTALPFLPHGLTIHQALAQAHFIVGPLSFLIIVWACWVLTTVVTPRHARPGVLVWVSLFMPTAAVLTAYILPGRVSHHGLSFALAVLSLACTLRFLRTPAPSKAFFAGLTLVLAMWSSIETLPFELLTFFVLWAGCLWRGQSAIIAHRLNINLIVLFASAVSFAVLALLIDPPFEGLMFPRTDRYSCVHIALLLLCGLAAGGCRWFVHIAPNTASKTKFLALCIVTAIFCLIGGSGITLLAAPPVNTADPVFRSYFFNHIIENRSLFKSRLPSDIALVCVQFVAVLICLRLTWRKRRRPQVWALALMTLILGTTTILGLLHVRLGSYAGGLGAIVCALALRRTLAQRHPQADGDLFMAFFTLFLGIFLLAQAYMTKAPSTQHNTDTCMLDAKTGAQIVQTFGANANIMNEIWLGPLLIWTTLPAGGVNIVAGPYHPNTQGIHDLGLLWTSDDTQPQGHKIIRNIIDKRHLTGVVLCIAANHVSNDVLPPTSIAHMIAAGHPPAWLEPVPLKENTNIRILRILPDQEPSAVQTQAH
ncbi:hypothetical protein predicted by Glimmer/Critica [Acetobacter ghanensis]|uniref:Uncharacterized protein n=1 Tax=Acetobacter ghanensis TaxID=431306 RepID=A0A0U5BH98_9PROT|nr:hypothetical protein AA18895_0570 [Acetobacter ghanensis DSM 18895]CEF54132.1 hypothetical protein predicted by Glimmer/Critica [Acetobacter ghanensis]